MFEHIEYEVADWTVRGLLVAPGADRNRPGVLVFHGGSGPTEHERRVARRLAALGHAVFVPDLFGEAFTDRAHGMRVIGGLVAEPERLRRRAAAALDGLRARGVDRVAAIGHCFGGLAALELARSGAAIEAAVSFHGALTTRAPARPGELRARVLACTGAADPFCPPEHRAAFEAEMTAAGVDWQHHIHASAQHGFTVPDIDPVKHPGCAYQELAANRSWAALLGLLAEIGA
ncbi:MAG TPA: dienelactone hydrolase family protein [Kofleriaceae bacterium]|nr:dienelactone hydrolase family protein [Kofleriaceae bacterium]